MKKLKTCLIVLIKISLICSVFFVLSPSSKVQAIFSDTASVSMGIKLELGTVSLVTKDTSNITAASFTEGDSILIASSKLVNEGSLSAKLGYKVNITKENGATVTSAELKDTSVTINFGTVAKEVTASSASLNTNSFIFAKDSNSKEVILEPNSKGEMPIKVSYKSTAPTKDEKIKVSVTFRLIQANAVNANDQLFSDEEILENTVRLVPKTNEEKSYWPDKSTFVEAIHGKYSYSLKNMKMLFSETYNSFNSTTRDIKNLNKATLYIQLPDNVPLTTTVTKNNGTKENKPTYIISQLSTGNEAIKSKSIELNEEHHGIVITFELDESYSYDPSNSDSSLNYANKDRFELSLNIEIQKYGMYENQKYGYYDNSHTYDQFFATRLVLSSDLVLPINGAYTKYAQLPIKLTKDKVNLTFKRFNTTNPESADPINFKDVQINAKDIGIEVQGGKEKQIVSLLNPDKTFSLWLMSNETLNNAVLNVKITGDTGNTLIISRKLINEIKSQSTNMRSMKVPLVEENNSQQIDTKIAEEEQSSSAKSSLTSDSKGETSVEKVTEEKVTEEKVIEKTKEVEEDINSSVVESTAEWKEKNITTKEKLDESATEAKQEINN
ncbi:hypothetical protein CAT7_01255 [Carnobacterium sp. AT7]|uniref:hypothetical protein n=2 Tax=Carnobacteriaceae TaxID=186828 RepID=UPI00015EF3B2|nr:MULTISPECIES: hypothetical protein [Carnobacterium]EDP67424.1 hypothetical protein CAT7_01255 [Carnobacterium sp. AT7]